jgi:hypothetical protein
MEATLIKADGHYYLVIPVSHNCFYGRESVYHILTSNEKWAAKKLPDIVGYPNVESKALHDLHYKQNPIMSNAFKPYYKVETCEDNTYQDYDFSSLGIDNSFHYIFTYIEPYDD